MNRTIIIAATLATATIAMAVVTAVTAVVPVHGATRCTQIAIVGDSLTSLGATALHAQFPTAIINARGRRTTAEGEEAANGINASNIVDCWVFALGTNDIYGWHDTPHSRAVIDGLLNLIGRPERVWWILPQVTPASKMNAATYDSAIPSDVTSVDLHTPPADFGPDGVHLTATGYQHRAAAIAAAIDA